SPRAAVGVAAIVLVVRTRVGIRVRARRRHAVYAWREVSLREHGDTNHADVSRAAGTRGVGTGAGREANRRGLRVRDAPAFDIHRAPRGHEIAALGSPV